MCSLILGFTTVPAYSATQLTASHLYYWAKTKNYSRLNQFKSYINLHNQNNKTALCLAQEAKDRNAYTTLIKFGASTKVSCHDDDDPICAVIIKEETKVSPAALLLGAGALGAAYLLSDNDSNDKSTPKVCDLNEYPYANLCPTGMKEINNCTDNSGTHYQCECDEAQNRYQDPNKCSINQSGKTGYNCSSKDENGCFIRTNLACISPKVDQCAQASEGYTLTDTGADTFAGEQECRSCSYSCDETTLFATCPEDKNCTPVEEHGTVCHKILSDKCDSDTYTSTQNCSDTTGLKTVDTCTEKTATGDVTYYQCECDTDKGYYPEDTEDLTKCGSGGANGWKFIEKNINSTNCKTCQTLECGPNDYGYGEPNCAKIDGLSETSSSSTFYHGNDQCFSCSYTCAGEYYEEESDCLSDASVENKTCISREFSLPNNNTKTCYYQTPKTCGENMYITEKECEQNGIFTCKNEKEDGTGCWFATNCATEQNEEYDSSIFIQSSTLHSGYGNLKCYTYEYSCQNTFHTGQPNCESDNAYIGKVINNNKIKDTTCYQCEYICNTDNGWNDGDCPDKMSCSNVITSPITCHQVDACNTSYNLSETQKDTYCTNANIESCTDNNGTHYKCSCNTSSYPFDACTTGTTSISSCTDSSGTYFQCACDDNYGYYPEGTELTKCGNSGENGWEWSANETLSQNNITLSCAKCTAKDCIDTNYNPQTGECNSYNNLQKTQGASTGWNGENQCFECHYECEAGLYPDETTCKNDTQDGEYCIPVENDLNIECYTTTSCPTEYPSTFASIEACQLDGYDCEESPTAKGCYKRTARTCTRGETDINTKYCAQTNGGNEFSWELKDTDERSGGKICYECNPVNNCDEGTSSDYTTDEKCPTQNNKTATSSPVTNKYNGSAQCYECTYTCDETQNAYKEETDCITETNGCSLDNASGCYIRDIACPEGEDLSPTDITICGTYPSYVTATKVLSGTISGNNSCYKCNYTCNTNMENIFDNQTSCENNTQNIKAYSCAKDETYGCYQRNNSLECTKGTTTCAQTEEGYTLSTEPTGEYDGEDPCLSCSYACDEENLYNECPEGKTCNTVTEHNVTCYKVTGDECNRSIYTSKENCSDISSDKLENIDTCTDDSGVYYQCGCKEQYQNITCDDTLNKELITYSFNIGATEPLICQSCEYKECDDPYTLHSNNPTCSSDNETYIRADVIKDINGRVYEDEFCYACTYECIGNAIKGDESACPNGYICDAYEQKDPYGQTTVLTCQVPTKCDNIQYFDKEHRENGKSYALINNYNIECYQQTECNEADGKYSTEDLCKQSNSGTDLFTCTTENEDGTGCWIADGCQDGHSESTQTSYNEAFIKSPIEHTSGNQTCYTYTYSCAKNYYTSTINAPKTCSTDKPDIYTGQPNSYNIDIVGIDLACYQCNNSCIDTYQPQEGDAYTSTTNIPKNSYTDETITCYQKIECNEDEGKYNRVEDCEKEGIFYCEREQIENGVGCWIATRCATEQEETYESNAIIRSSTPYEGYDNLICYTYEYSCNTANGWRDDYTAATQCSALGENGHYFAEERAPDHSITCKKCENYDCQMDGSVVGSCPTTTIDWLKYEYGSTTGYTATTGERCWDCAYSCNEGYYKELSECLNEYENDESECIDHSITIAGVGYTCYGPNTTLSLITNDLEKTTNTDTIELTSEGDENIYGMSSSNDITNKGTINITHNSEGYAYGMYGASNNKLLNDEGAKIEITNNNSGTAVGMYASSGGEITNKGNITINGTQGTAVGILGEGQNTITNESEITVSGTNAYGIRVLDGTETTVTNTGTITVNGTNEAYGIYIDQNGDSASVTNEGTINVNGDVNSTNAIVLNGAELRNKGTMSVSGELDLNTMGASKVFLEDGAIYEAQTIKGNLTAGTSTVMNDNLDTYIKTDAIKSENINELDISSESALFTAKVNKNNSGNTDVILERKNFSEFTPNSSMSDYLTKNYQAKNFEEKFNSLKSQTEVMAVQTELADWMAYDKLLNFADENFQVLRSLNRTMADTILKPTDEPYRVIAGYDNFNLETDNKGLLSGYDLNAHSMFTFGDKRLNNWSRLGLGISFTDLSTSYEKGGNRDLNIVSIFMPYMRKFSDQLNLVTILNLGYGYGDYDRGSNRDADINDFIYGLTNELRYSVNLNDFAELEPALMLNAIGYVEDELDEKSATDAIETKRTNNLSVELGAGLFLKKEVKMEKYGKLGFKIGGVYYHEFAKPYRDITLHHKNDPYNWYRINDYANLYQRDRAVLEAVIDYAYKDLALYVKYNKLIQKNNPDLFDMGVKFNF